MTDKLSVYRGVCRAVGERKLANLTEPVKVRRLIDDVWADPAGVLACLQAKYWNFAMETSSFTNSPSVTPEFGFTYAFDKPEDWLRTFQVSNEPMFTNRRYRFDDRGDYWQADDDTIYAKFLSSSITRGMNLSLWTPNFCLFVENHLGSLIVVDIDNSKTDRDELMKLADRYMNRAAGTDAMDESMRQIPAGSWSTARRGRFSGHENG